MDAVLDVSGIYDPSIDRFDHHQRGFEQDFGHGFVTKLSSAGLVYKGIDGIDNGVNQYDTDKPPRYVNDTHLSARMGRLNPDWNDEQTTDTENNAFHRAMSLTGGEFLESVQHYAKSWLPACAIVMDCIANRKKADSTGEIMVLKHVCPWKHHLADLEKELKIEPTIKYVLYEDGRSKGWRIQAVAEVPESFETRLPLPAVWRGLRDEELSKVSWIEGGVFVQMNGLIAGNKRFEGALAMAVQPHPSTGIARSEILMR